MNAAKNVQMSRAGFLTAAAALPAALSLAKSAPAFAEEAGEGSMFPLTVETRYLSTAYPDENYVTQVVESVPQKILVEGQQMIDFMVYFGLADKIYGVASVDETSLPAEYQETIDSLNVVNPDNFLTAEEIYAAADAGVDFFLTANPSMIRESGLKMDEVNELGITYVYTFDMSFDGCYNLGLGNFCSKGDLYDIYRDMGILFGIEDQVEQWIKEQNAEMRQIIAKTKESSLAQDRTVMFAFTTGPSYIITNNYTGCTIQEFVSMCGGTWVTPARGDYNSWDSESIEAIIALDPEVILYCAADTIEEPLEDIEALQDVTAVKNGAVYHSPTLPCPSNAGRFMMAEDLREVAQALYPDVDFSA